MEATISGQLASTEMQARREAAERLINNHEAAECFLWAKDLQDEAFVRTPFFGS